MPRGSGNSPVPSSSGISERPSIVRQTFLLRHGVVSASSSIVGARSMLAVGAALSGTSSARSRYFGGTEM